MWTRLPTRAAACLRCLSGGALLLLLGCGSVPTREPAPLSTAPPLPALQTRPEQEASAPCGRLWIEGEEVTLRGLYRTSGANGYLDVLRLDSEGLPCRARFFLDRDIGLGPVAWADPPYLEVRGRPLSGRWDSAGLWDLQVAVWTVLPLDTAAVRAACQQAVAAQAPALQSLDWAGLALPGFVAGTTGFHPSGEALASCPVQLEGAEDQRPLLVLTARGPDLPAVRPLVNRWVEVLCVYDLEQGRVVELVATIQGEVQE